MQTNHASPTVIDARNRRRPWRSHKHYNAKRVTLRTHRTGR